MPTKRGSADGSLKTQQRLRENLLLRKSAQDLVQIPDRDLAGRRFLRLAAMLDLAAGGFGCIARGAGHGNFVAQAVRQKFRAKLAKIVVPADFRRRSRSCDRNRASRINSRYCSFCEAARAAISSSHSPVVHGAAACRRIWRTSSKKWSCPLTPAYGTKLRIENASTKRIVEILIGERLRGGHFAHRRTPAGCGSWRGALRLHEREWPARSTQRPSCGGIANKGFRINPAAQVVVQVRAFGHAHKECAQVERICAGRLIGSRGALFGIAGTGGAFLAAV